jgi:hypothetical protein
MPAALRESGQPVVSDALRGFTGWDAFPCGLESCSGIVTYWTLMNKSLLIIRPEGGTAERDVVGAAVLVFGLANLATAALMWFAPHAFFDDIGPFGTYNAHFVRDLGTWVAALGIGLVLSAWRRGLRVPLLLVSAIQGAMHLANHLIDVTGAHPGWAGPANVAGLLAYESVVVWAYLRARAEEA